jgi:hypothetical protein
MAISEEEKKLIELRRTTEHEFRQIQFKHYFRLCEATLSRLHN